MKVVQPAVEQEDGTINNAHEMDIVCANCGYDLDENELAANTCNDCGHKLNLKKSIKITVTSIPLFGDAM